jgi:3-isopropylmalate dehydratase small subunit
MGNSNCSIFLGSPATVALSAIKGEIISPGIQPGQFFKRVENDSKSVGIQITENRRFNGVWAYPDVDNLNTDQMFAGNLTYEINSSDPHKIVSHLLKGFDTRFAELVENDDIVICGENFGCGSSREHPSVGFVHAGVKSVIVKSVSRIFYRSAINQGLPIIVLPDAVNAYQPGDMVTVLLREAKVTVGERTFRFNPLPEQLMEILTNGGLVKTLANDPKL